jgi:hypothetical protein
MVDEGHTLVAAVLVSASKADERIFAPKKELDPRTLSKISASLQGFIALGRGTLMGAKGAIVVPSSLHAEREGHAPIVAVLLSSANSRLEYPIDGGRNRRRSRLGDHDRGVQSLIARPSGGKGRPTFKERPPVLPLPGGKRPPQPGPYDFAISRGALGLLERPRERDAAPPIEQRPRCAPLSPDGRANLGRRNLIPLAGQPQDQIPISLHRSCKGTLAGRDAADLRRRHLGEYKIVVF